MLPERSWDQSYALFRIEDVLTPALLLYPDFIAANIERTLHLLSGDPNRWRVHNVRGLLHICAGDINKA